MADNAIADDGLDIGIDTSIRDEPGYRIQFRVEAADDPGQMELRLEVDDDITWWKSASFFYNTGLNTRTEYRRIETKDAVKSAEAIIYTPEVPQFGRVELWKGGVLAAGALAATMDLNTWANRGRRLVFHWLED
jgi:hypothetical protein